MKDDLHLSNGRVISYAEMPEDNEELIRMVVDFPSSSETETQWYKDFEEDLIEYLRREGEEVTRDELKFLRSAMLNNEKYWIWEFMTPDNEKCYATVCEQDSQQVFSYDQDRYGLSPEQFLVGDYFELY